MSCSEMTRRGVSWVSTIMRHPFFPIRLAGTGSDGGSIVVQASSGISSLADSRGAKREDLVLDMSWRSIQVVSLVENGTWPASSPTRRQYQRAATGSPQT